MKISGLQNALNPAFLDRTRGFRYKFNSEGEGEELA